MEFRYASGAILAMAGALSACDQIGPVDVSLKADRAVQLKDERNQVVSLEAGSVHAATVTAKSLTKKVYLNFGGADVVFRNLELNSTKDGVSVSPDQSGQSSGGDALGLTASRKQVCNPDCETVSQEVLDTSCTRYEQRPVQRCDPNGCWTDWEQYPVPGRQQVERTYTTRTFAYDLHITGSSGRAYVNGTASRPETEIEDRALSACY